IGCYGFADATELTRLFDPAADRYLSDVIAKMIGSGRKVIVVPTERAEFFGDSKKLTAALTRRDIFGGTILCDLDGVIVEHEDRPDYSNRLKVLPGSREKLAEWRDQGYLVMLITARDPAREAELKAALTAADIPYHRLITGVASGPRY